MSARLASSLVLLLVATHAAAAHPMATKRLAVGYADLDVSKAEGRAALQQRLHRAAKIVCGPEPDIRALDAKPDYQACLAGSEEKAMAAATTSGKLAQRLP